MKSFLHILIIFFVLTASCTKEQFSVPELPSKKSFAINLTDFSKQQRNESNSINWDFASSKLSVWDSLINKNMEIPIASFPTDSTETAAVYQSENTWLWEYSFQKETKMYSAKLFGTLNKGSVHWEMFISKDGEYDDFMWFYGESDYNNKNVEWTLFNNPDDNIEKININYQSKTDSTYVIKYINILTEESKTNDFLKFDNNNDEVDFNYSFKIYETKENILTEIEYNPTYQNGRVMNYLKYQDNSWHCWNNIRQDIECN